MEGNQQTDRPLSHTAPHGEWQADEPLNGEGLAGGQAVRMPALGGIVVCADDFGLNEAVDHAVLELAAARRLNATSCLVHGPSFTQNASALRTAGIQTGLHVNFTEPLPGTSICMPLARFMRQAWLRRLDGAGVEFQIQSQLDLFRQVMGRLPDFIDGHQHVHQFPVVREALFRVLDRAFPSGIRPWLRYTRAGQLTGLPVSQRFKAAVIEHLGSAALARQARRRGYPLNRRFMGVYDFTGGQAGYQRLLQAWLVHMQPGDLIMCHPARQVVTGDALGVQREAEFRVLASDTLRDFMVRHSVPLA